MQWIVEPCHREIMVDYESFSGGLYRLFENAHKYTAYDSTVRVSFGDRGGSFVMSVQMNSLAIRPDEVDRIFDEGYSGEVARKLGKAGSGIGMYVVREMLRANECEIRVVAHPPTSASIKDLQYANNVFEVIFKNSLIRDQRE